MAAYGKPKVHKWWKIGRTNSGWPRAGRLLAVTFGADRYDLPAELLRVLSPSAEVRGHGPADRKIVGGKRDVAIRDVIPCGHYAVRLAFDDGHDTGLYTWAYLRELGRDQARLWQGYLDDLAATGGRRGPAGG